MQKGDHMKLCVLMAAALLIVTLQARGATIGFDELQTGEDVLDYYNGGFGSLGTGPGPSSGVIFSTGWIVGSPDVYGALNGESAAILRTGLIDIPAGWSGPTSFYYSGSMQVNFYSQESGLGTLVGSLQLASEPSFFAAGATLPLFRSAVFTGGGRIDALTNGFFVIPEPAALKLLLVGFIVFSLAVLDWKQLRHARI
jgi:hypothetical protein